MQYGEERRIVIDVLEKNPSMVRKSENMQEGELALFVLIPTRDRSVSHLRITMESVLEQARRHHRMIHLIISDQSDAAHEERNRRCVQKLLKKFPEFQQVIHYYPASENALIQQLLSQSTESERKAYAAFVPSDGHYGANRNRLALLALLHARTANPRRAIFLHLDDDTPLLSIPRNPNASEPPYQGKLMRNSRNVLGTFIARHRQALKNEMDGYASPMLGLPDAAVSRGVNVHTTLRNALRWAVSSPGIGFGWGRTLSFSPMCVPYRPYGTDEDAYHSNEYLLQTDFDNPPLLIHLGMSGQRPNAREEKYNQLNKHALAHTESWKKLARRAAGMM